MHISIPSGSTAFSGHREFDVGYAKDEYGQARASVASTDDVPGFDPVGGGDWVVNPVDWSGDVDGQVSAGLKLFPEWAAASIA